MLISNELYRAPRAIGENSWAYTHVMKIFELLEKEYCKIEMKIDPSPNQFKKIEEFEECVENLKESFKNLKLEILRESEKVDENDVNLFKETSDSLLNEFLKRCNDYVQPKLLYQIKRGGSQMSLMSQIRKVN